MDTSSSFTPFPVLLHGIICVCSYRHLRSMAAIETAHRCKISQFLCTLFLLIRNNYELSEDCFGHRFESTEFLVNKIFNYLHCLCSLVSQWGSLDVSIALTARITTARPFGRCNTSADSSLSQSGDRRLSPEGLRDT